MSESSPPENATETQAPIPSEAESSPSENHSQDRGSTKKQGSGGQILLFLLVLAVLAGSGAGGLFLWNKLQTTRQELNTGVAALTQRLEQFEQQTNASLSTDIQAIKTQQQALEDAVADLRNQQKGDSRTWDIQEIATLLQIANDRLHLEKEVAPSLAALEAADRHLRALKNPGLLEIRRRLAEEISTLRAAPNPDISGMALSLDALIQGIDRLPIAGSSLQPQPSASSAVSETGWRGILHDLWEKLKSLVTIHHQGEAERPLLAPDERYFLRQNLRLELVSARIALLRRDGQTYQQTLRDAQDWITRYFDNNAPPTAGALQELAHLQQVDITPKLPDISGSLNALQTWLTEQLAQQTPPTPETTQP